LSLKGILDPNRRPFSFELKKKILNKFWFRFQNFTTSET